MIVYIDPDLDPIISPLKKASLIMNKLVIKQTAKAYTSFNLTKPRFLPCLVLPELLIASGRVQPLRIKTGPELCHLVVIDSTEFFAIGRDLRLVRVT